MEATGDTVPTHAVRSARWSATALERLAEVAAAAAEGDEWALLLLGSAESVRQEISTPLAGVARSQHLQERQRLIDQWGPRTGRPRPLRHGAGLSLGVVLDGGRARPVRA